VETETNERVYADLVSGLLGARTDEATARFDSELDAAVERGEVGAELARRLRFWQRASLRALTDHTRTVLPPALGALEASRREAEAYVGELLGALRDAARTDEDLAAAVRAAATPGTPGPAPTVTLPGAFSLEPPRPRLLLASLVSTTARDTPVENRLST